MDHFPHLPAIDAVAAAEGVDPRELARNVADGSAVIMRRGDRAVGIGRGLRVKVNVNIGTSNLSSSPAEEVRKAVIAERYGADTISDLSMGEGVEETRQQILDHTTVPLTTVPVYQVASDHGIEGVTPGTIRSVLRAQAREGVSAWVIHCITREVLDLCRQEDRILGIVSRGGSITAASMLHHGSENPFLACFPDILEIAREHGVVLSLGNAARGRCIGDGWGPAQETELLTNVMLAEVAHRAGVGVIIEGAGGHVRYDRIAPTIGRIRSASRFPLFVAGPLPTDIALGFDHIAGCAGASAAAAAGADYLCAITPAEHLGLPDPGHVREGLIAFRIAAHIGDTVRLGRVGDDCLMARRRARLDRAGQIALAPDPDAARRIGGEGGRCTMCGDFCALLLMRNYLSAERESRPPPGPSKDISRRD
jgi:phosphomethylpyrimidine synthase